MQWRQRKREDKGKIQVYSNIQCFHLLYDHSSLFCEDNTSDDSDDSADSAPGDESARKAFDEKVAQVAEEFEPQCKSTANAYLSVVKGPWMKVRFCIIHLKSA